MSPIFSCVNGKHTYYISTISCYYTRFPYEKPHTPTLSGTLLYETISERQVSIPLFKTTFLAQIIYYSPPNVKYRVP